MKAIRSPLVTSELLWLWTSFTAVSAHFILATLPSGVSAQTPPMSFADYIDQLNWRGMFADGDTLFAMSILLGAASLVAAYSMTKPALGRLVLALIGILAPAIASGDISEFLSWSAEVACLAPRFTLQAFTGKAGGQFYVVDGLFAFAAIGWWMLFCLILVFRESIRSFRSHRTAEQTSGDNR